MMRSVLLLLFLLPILFAGVVFAEGSGIQLPEMVYVDGDSFTIGDATGLGDSDERPAHLAGISSFYVGKYEVTQELWQDVMGYNPAYWKADNLPVEQVSWYECIEFCNKLSLRAGLSPCYTGKGINISCDWSANGYRLPTEAEWEFAARGGRYTKNYLYPGGLIADSVAWYLLNSNHQTNVAGSREPNELGIHDMGGNVWEWCWDWSGRYTSSPQNNPRGPKSGSHRVIRGGAWYQKSYCCRSTFRYSSRSVIRSHGIGFRLAQTAG